MRKLFKLFISAVLAFVCIFGAVACGDNSEPNTIELGFGQNSAYFSSSVALVPISGNVPGDADITERAQVKISASRPVVMRVALTVEGTPIDGLMIQVDGYTAVNVQNGAVIYTSATPESETTLPVTVFLAKDAPDTAAGKEITFGFVLETEE